MKAWGESDAVRNLFRKLSANPQATFQTGVVGHVFKVS